MELHLLAPDNKTIWQAFVDDDMLVYNGRQYVAPEYATYVEVMLPWQNAQSSVITAHGTEPIELVTRALMLLKVVKTIGNTPLPWPIVATENPSPECVCLVTCAGTRLAYVTVHTVPIEIFVPPDPIPDPGQTCSSCGQCSCNTKPCCSPDPELATNIRCEPSSNFPIFY